MAAAKARGARLGNPAPLAAAVKGAGALKVQADRRARAVLAIIHRIEGDDGIATLEGMARALNARGVSTARGGKWYATTVRNLLKRTNAL